MPGRSPRPRLRSTLLICVWVLVAAGSFVPPAGAAGTGEFCGPGWQRVTIPGVRSHNRLRDLDGTTGDLWAVGSTFGGAKPSIPLVERWDGDSWSASTPTSSVARAQLRGVARLGPTNVWAVGGDTDTGANRDPLAMHWTGSSWTQTSLPALSGATLFGVDGSSAADVWAVGSVGDPARTLALHWNGTAWTRFTTPSPGDDAVLLDVTAVSGTDAWAVGTHQDVAGAVGAPMILHWGGSAWTIVSEPSGATGALDAAATAPDGDVWTAGGGGSADPTAGIVAHRQGGAWSTTTSALPASWSAVAPLSDTDAWVGGDDGRAPWSSHWDGSTWRTIVEPSARDAETTRSAGLVAPSADEIWTVGSAQYPAASISGYREGPTAMRLCPLDVTDSAISKPSSRVFQGSGTLWRFPASNHGSRDVTEALGLGQGGAPLFTTGARPPGTTGTFRVDHAGTFAVRDTTSGHVSELTVPTEALPKKAPLGTSFTVYTSAMATLPSYLGTDIRYRKPGSEFWYRLVSGTQRGATRFSPNATGVYTLQARLRNRTTGAVSGWSPFAMINVVAP
jgi:hypothetical protein